MSEFRKISAGRSDPQVEAWAAGVDGGSLYLSVLTVLELETGLLLLDRYDKAQSVLPSFGERILNVDIAIARRTARFYASNRRPANDASIAARDVVHGLSLDPRNVVDVDDDVFSVINPWTAAMD